MRVCADIYAHICTVDPTVEDTPCYHVYLIAALASAILLVSVSKIYPDLGRPTDLAMIGFDAKVPTMGMSFAEQCYLLDLMSVTWQTD